MVRSISLSTKMSCAVSLLVAAVLLALAFLAQHYFEGHLKETISRQQFTMVSALAEQIDDKILSARDELAVVAKSITPEIVRDHARAEHFLKDRLVVSSLIFDSGLFLLTPSGTMFAGTSMEPQMRGRNYSYRDYFRKTVATGKPCISDPFFSTKQSGHPTVVFTAPVYDRHGQMIAILLGGLDLLKDNFLGKLATVRIAKTGYLYLYNTSRTMIVHPDRTRILQRDVPPGANRLFDLAIEGFEGTGATVNSRGLHALSSFKHLKSASWILAANYPEAEAYAPTLRAKRYFLVALTVVVTLTVLLVWSFTQRLTAPLRVFTAHVRELASGEEPHRPIPFAGGDEIGTLAGAFNQMLEGLAAKEKALLESEARLRHAQKMEAIGTLAGGIAHDFNTILTAVTGYGNLLRTERDRNSALASDCLEELLAAAGRGTALTRNLLTYSRQEGSNLVPVDLSGIVQRMEGFLAGLVGESVAISVTCVERQLRIMADQGQVEQVLMNLATNARDAMAQGGDVMIRTDLAELDHEFARSHGLERGRSHALLSVADSGAGMDESILERIFEPFFTTKGTGLGLAIVYGIVRSHKGGIAVRSRPGIGTVFELYFPLLDGEERG